MVFVNYSRLIVHIQVMVVIGTNLALGLVAISERYTAVQLRTKGMDVVRRKDSLLLMMIKLRNTELFLFQIVAKPWKCQSRN